MMTDPLVVSCPYCKAGPGVKCHTAQGAQMRQSHAQRVKLAEKVPGPEPIEYRKPKKPKVKKRKKKH